MRKVLRLLAGAHRTQSRQGSDARSGFADHPHRPHMGDRTLAENRFPVVRRTGDGHLPGPYRWQSFLSAIRSAAGAIAIHCRGTTLILAIVGLGTCLYLAYIYGDIEANPFTMRPTMFIIGLILLPMVWESLRRTTGWSLTLVFSFLRPVRFCRPPDARHAGRP